MPPILDRTLLSRPPARHHFRARSAYLAAFIATVALAGYVQAGGGTNRISLPSASALAAVAATMSSGPDLAYERQSTSSPAISASSTASSPAVASTTIVEQYISQPAIERTVYVPLFATSSVTEADLASLRSELESQLNAVSLQNSSLLVGAYQAASYQTPFAPATTIVQNTGSSDWGSIGGTLSDQSDLAAALAAKLNLSDWYATTTDALREGTTNLYYTDARVAGYLGAVPQSYFFSTTSASYFLSQQNVGGFSTTSASYFLSQNQPLAFSTSSASYFLAQNPSPSFSTSSASYWQSVTNFFATSSSDYWLSTKTTDSLPQGSTNLYFTDALAQGAISVSGSPLTYASGVIGINQVSALQAGYLSAADWTNFNGKLASTSISGGAGISYNSATGQIANTGVVSNTGDWAGTLGGYTAAQLVTGGFSTSSAAYWQSQNNFFSTSSASYFLAQNQSLAFATTSASYFLNQNQSAAFSTTSASYFLAQNQPLAFSTSSASYFLSLNSVSTSTFGFVTATSTAATSTFAGGFSAGGTGLVYNWATGWTGIGTGNPSRLFNVFGTSANPQERISYDATRYAEWYADAAGDLNLTVTGKTLNFLNGTLYLCDGGACPSTPVQGYPSSFSTNGNLVAGGIVYAGGFGPVSCPSGMIPVPPSPQDGTQGFCVDKYIASSNSGNEQSTASGAPWVSITQYQARAQCIRAGKHLITEAQWQAIAHNIEQVASNWSTGSVGVLNGSSQGLPDGLSNSGSSAQTAASAGACSGSVTGNTQNCTTGGGTWYDDMREQKLSNGQTIWDFGGNVWQWVDQTNAADYPMYNSGSTGWVACSTSGDGTCGNTLTTNDEWYEGGTSGTVGFLRGGQWNDGAHDGAFALDLDNAPGNTNTGTNVGFRCSR